MLGIDKDKIAIGGDSAGGNLAACVAQMALDRKEISLCFQLLVYPVCDHTLSTASMYTFQDTPLWNAPSSKLMWDVYLKGKDRNNLPKYVSSLQRTDLKGLPPTYIETAEFDCLRDEGLLYAQKLNDTNITVSYTHLDVYKRQTLRRDRTGQANRNQNGAALFHLFSETSAPP